MVVLVVVNIGIEIMVIKNRLQSLLADAYCFPYDFK